MQRRHGPTGATAAASSSTNGDIEGLVIGDRHHGGTNGGAGLGVGSAALDGCAGNGRGKSNGSGNVTGLGISNGAANGSIKGTRRLVRRKKKKVRSNAAFSTFYGPQSDMHFFLPIAFVIFLFSIGFFAFYSLFFGVPSFSFLPSPLAAITSQIYYVPGSLPDIGDKSEYYLTLRQQIDQELPINHRRSLERVQELSESDQFYQPIPIPRDDPQVQHYDVFDCPFDPPSGYPYAWNLLDILHHWSTDDTVSKPETIYHGICVFDFKTQYDRAMNYRRLELPFAVRGDPHIAMTVERWNYPGYMEKLMSDVKHRTEYSVNNHFMYWLKPNSKVAIPNIHRPKESKRLKKQIRIQAPPDWSQPTKMMRMDYAEWIQHANVTDTSLLGPDKPHWYYRLIGCGYIGECDKGSSEYLFDELTFFQPLFAHGKDRDEEGDDDSVQRRRTRRQVGLKSPPSDASHAKSTQLYLADHSQQKGIHCRFGMQGVIAENHFDGSRNSIALLGGRRRYILSHPNQCENMALFPNGHPSARHSAVDWGNPNLEEFPQFVNAKSNEIVLEPGDLLYLPTNWFHFIVSLELNFQCNTRSGINTEYMKPINECGF